MHSPVMTCLQPFIYSIHVQRAFNYATLYFKTTFIFRLLNFDSKMQVLFTNISLRFQPTI